MQCLYVIVNNVSAKLRNNRVFLLLYGHYFILRVRTVWLNKWRLWSHIPTSESTIHCLNLNNFYFSLSRSTRCLFYSWAEAYIMYEIYSWATCRFCIEGYNWVMHCDFGMFYLQATYRHKKSDYNLLLPLLYYVRFGRPSQFTSALLPAPPLREVQRGISHINSMFYKHSVLPICRRLGLSDQSRQ
jgi:hypothetical protein